MSEIREAAERLRKHLKVIKRSETYSLSPYCIGDGWSLQLDDDEAALARAYLAEHQPDDDAPVTDKWLYSVGFSDDRTGTPTLGPLHIQYAVLTDDNDREYPAYACIRSLPITVPKTRGDVRRLCRALGIERLESLTPAPD